MLTKLIIKICFFGSLLFFSQATFGQLTCINNQQIDLGNQCQVQLPPQNFIQEIYPDYSYFSLEIINSSGSSLGNIATGQLTGGTYSVKVTNNNTGTSCTAQNIVFVDTEPPAFPSEVVNDTVTCNFELDALPPPPATDNCASNLNYVLLSENNADPNICDDGFLLVERTWQAIDPSGNASAPCTQKIWMAREDLVFPKDIVWTLAQYNFASSITDAAPVNDYIFDLDVYDGQDDIDVDPGLGDPYVLTTGSGVVKGAESPLCGFNVSFSDSTIAGCGGGFVVLRKWKVQESCSGTSFSHTQRITILGGSPAIDFSNSPGYEMGENGEVEYHIAVDSLSNNCTATGFVNYPVFVNTPIETIEIFTSKGSLINTNAAGGYLPASGYQMGIHQGALVINVTDSCGNSFTLKANLVVEDLNAPVAVCKPVYKVILDANQSGISINAISFDGGSTDNCCIDHFEVKRNTQGCGASDGFMESINICCEDSPGDLPVTVRVFDCAGNYSECSSFVNITDLVAPECIAPADVTVLCNNLEEDLSVYGSAQAIDACGTAHIFSESVDWTGFDTGCHTGTITRNWIVMDKSGNTAACLQKIKVLPALSFEVTFPDDVTDNITDTAALVISGNCGPLSWDVSDEVVINEDQCSGTIFRTYRTYQSCDFDSAYQAEIVPNPAGIQGPTAYANYQNHGVFEYTQQIQIYDSSAPEINIDQQMLSICAPSGQCDADVMLSMNAQDDFNQAEQLQIGYFYELDTDNDGAFDLFVSSSDAGAPAGALSYAGKTVECNITIPQVPAGIHRITWIVKDLCGGTTMGEQYFEVKDCESPALTCHDVTVNLQQGQAADGEYILTPDEVISSLADNCTAYSTMEFALGPLGGQPVFTPSAAYHLDCGDLGQQALVLSVQDASGNESTCQVNLILLDTLNFCQRVQVTGTVQSPGEAPIANVNITAKCENPLVPDIVAKTDDEGEFAMDLPQGHNYELLVEKTDQSYSDGVTMQDAAIIIDQVLGNPVITSPYQVLAANVLAENEVDVWEAVEIRRLVLGKIDHFAAVPVWGFTNKDADFPEMFNPYGEELESIAIDNLTASTHFDLVGFKYGDLDDSNSSVAPKVAAASRQSALLRTEEIWMEAGKQYEIPFFIEQEGMTSYQMTLHFEPAALKCLGYAGAKEEEVKFNFAQAADGRIAIGDVVENQENGPAFVLKFEAQKNLRLSDALRLTDEMVRTSAFLREGEELGLTFEFTGARESSIHVFQNEPNPFSGPVAIPFELEKEQKVRITILSATGRILATKESVYPAGFHQEVFGGKMFDAPGVYFYRVETDELSIVKKMNKM